jgi:RNA polymerase sigma factor (TIGR02999 family)
MSDVTPIQSSGEQNDPQSTALLLSLVYDELRKLAAQRLAHENPGQTLQATALVHDAYLRLVGSGDARRWESRGHFFAAAAEAMRRILVEQARRKHAIKRGGLVDRQDLDAAEIESPASRVDVLELDEALARLAARDPEAAELVKLRYFAGMTILEAATVLGLSERAAERVWTYARSFLRNELGNGAA